MTERNSHERCDLVVSHEGMLASIAKDIEYIKGKIDNGLTEAMSELKRTVEDGIKSEEIRCAVRKSNWLTHTLEGSTKKFVGIVFLVVLLNAATSTGFWALLKTNWLKETPGQQREILLLHQDDAYHTDTLKDGRIVLHADDYNKPAWVLNPAIKQWERAAGMRTEEQIRNLK